MTTVLDELISRIADPDLRAAVAEQIALLQKRVEWGLVFPRHLPENVSLPSFPIRRGVKVTLRDGSTEETWRVRSVSNNKAVLMDESGAESTRPTEDLVVIRGFGEPLYPGLRNVESLARVEGKPHHVVINAENFHGLETLLYTHEHKVDLIYIDPPYNTGDTNWSYNNRYVDLQDEYRHSKWLSFIEKRLVLGQQLLKDDGVLVVTCDENEAHHLGVLLEELFPRAARQMVTIVINPSGTSAEGLSRVEEYAFFVFLGGTLPSKMAEDLLTPVKKKGKTIRWESLMRGGNAWYRESRPNLCYPVLLDPKSHQIVGFGEPFSGKDEAKRPKLIDGKLAAWPVRDDRRLGIWRVEGPTLMNLAEKGYAYVSSANPDRGTWTIRYLLGGTLKLIDAGAIRNRGILENGRADLEIVVGLTTIPKTVWHRGRHTAGGAGGTHMVSALLGEKGLFTYPKSVYAVMDTISAAVGSRRDAVILDFFAGTGTTLHATALLNRQDGGSRQCLLVTNNEVNGELAVALKAEGLRPGDPEWEARGVFHSATKPRLVAAMTGRRSDGQRVEGEYEDGTEIGEGLPENVDFFELEYLDRTNIERGSAFEAVAPILWLRAGAVGTPIEQESSDFALSPSAGYAVLFDVTAAPMLLAEIEKADPNIRMVFVVTDSLAHYQHVVASLPPEMQTLMLYEDYLENFALNTRGPS